MQLKGDKMMAKWIGPYAVAEGLGKGVFCLKNPASGHVLKKAVNAIRLKQYHAPSDSHPDANVSA